MNHRRRRASDRTPRLVIIATMAFAAWALPAAADTWRVALIGDTPYSSHERAELPKMLAAIVADNVQLIAHIGDIKHGRDRCDDALFEDRRQLFDASPVPFVFVPGDNEWSDCDRTSAGGHDPLERLDRLRGLFWATPASLGGNPVTVERQPGGYPEHSRFRLGPVLFVTLNLPGGNNWGLTAEPRAEWKRRNPEVLAWLKDSFALARRERLGGVVLLFHANPGFRHFSQGLTHRAFGEFLEVLRSETLAFPGQVVAVHGDTHISRVDQPLRDAGGRTIANFTRVETFGYPLMGWTRAVIDTEAPLLIRFDTHPWPTKSP
jgi:hypothetical protein